MMESAVCLPDPLWSRLNLSWVMFFVAMGSANLYVAYNFNTETWVNFKLFGIMGLTVLFVIAQAAYLVRHTEQGLKDL
jgi:intracellular septation protein